MRSCAWRCLGANARPCRSWLIVLMVQLGKFGLTEANIRRLQCLSMFWHFLDLVWVGVFSFVYLAGVLR